MADMDHHPGLVSTTAMRHWGQKRAICFDQDVGGAKGCSHFADIVGCLEGDHPRNPHHQAEFDNPNRLGRTLGERKTAGELLHCGPRGDKARVRRNAAAGGCACDQQENTS